MDIRLNIFDENNRWVGVDYLTEKGKWMHKWVHNGEVERGSWRGRAIGDNDINWHYESVQAEDSSVLQANELLPLTFKYMKYDQQYLYEMYNATCTDDGTGTDEPETYENWLERQLIYRMERIDELKKASEWISFADNKKAFNKLLKSEGDCLLKFDNDTIARFNEKNHPFAIMTHFKSLKI